MSCAQDTIAMDYVDYDPARITRVKKMIWSDADCAFHTHYFLRVYCETIHNREETVAWLEEQFGPEQYQGIWWRDPGNSRWVWLTDSIATFWQLKYGGIQ